MDFRLYARVLGRHKLLVLGGLVLALALAELSVVTVSPSGTVKYRQAELWASTTRLALAANQGWRTKLLPGGADPGVYAAQYAIWATSDPVRQLMLRDGPIKGQFTANNVTTPSGVGLPFLDLTAISNSPSAAFALSGRLSKALRTYIQIQQQASGIPPSGRVPVTEVKRNAPVVSQPRSKTLPILIFLAVMLAFVGLAFILENASARERELDETEPDREDESPDRIEALPVGVEPEPSDRRRTA